MDFGHTLGTIMVKRFQVSVLRIVYLVSIQKRDILPNIKERDDCNHPGFHRDRHPYSIVFRGFIRLWDE